MVSVYTVAEICKKCYSCVRACPTKALQVRGGQAEIIEEVCISCGWCVSACSQGAKRVRSSLERVRELLAGPGKKYAIIAPSFPAAFLDVAPGALVGSLREAGFDGVYEVAFGADLVSYAYYRAFKEIQDREPATFIISSPCPAVVQYVEKLLPELVPHLAPIVSPMEATARVIRQKVDPEGRIVFIGPCVAKKTEAARGAMVDEAITFDELGELLRGAAVDLHGARPSDFDPPRANLGRIYPVAGGLLKAASIGADILDSPVYVVEGQQGAMDILNVLSNRVKTGQKVNYRVFDLLFCEGCIGGPVMVNALTHYERRKFVVQYMRERPLVRDIEEWAERHQEYLTVDLATRFAPVVREQVEATEEEIRRILSLTGKNTAGDELNCGACGYPSCREKARAVWQGKAEVEMCLPFLISKIEKTVNDLTENQARLIQAEKLASMGQMAAGIAHEINNPLGVVLMYAHLLKEEMSADSPGQEDASRIIHEAERTRQIVRGILNFAREEKLDRKPTDVNALVQSSVSGILGTSRDGKYHVQLSLDDSLAPQWVDASQLRQVFDNLLTNAKEAMPEGGTIRLSTQDGEDEFSVAVADSGPGIPEENLPKMFTPFFTTKKVGKGTGLGLSVCYGIVKMHGGAIQATNNPEGGACFTVRIRHYLKEGNGGSDSHRG
jgi:signal transduction histidine kinase/NAD-dependent dihydropyrimidine dehydrogenase PreA subunit